MKIESLAASIIQPLRKRKKKFPKIPPWASEVPPDRVEINLQARSNRYSRPTLRFNQFGSTRTKYQQRLAIYQDHLDLLPYHVLTPEEIQAELLKMRGRVEDDEQLADTPDLELTKQEENEKLEDSIEESIGEILSEAMGLKSAKSKDSGTKISLEDLIQGALTS
jgi:hypothetical protein